MSAHRGYSFFLAGTMQGSRPGDEETNQDYRRDLRAVISARLPVAEIVCPRELLHRALADERAAIRAEHAALRERPSMLAKEHTPRIARLRALFCELTDLAGTVDVLVAYLPEHEASMGTAAEMWSAKKGGATVVAITQMRQNLAVLSIADAIVPSIEAFGDLLETDFLTRERAARSTLRPGSEER